MSTLKSSAEDLTLNADGSGNDVIIQSDGSTKAIVNAEGNVGIGVTPESGWDSKFTVLEIAPKGIITSSDAATDDVSYGYNWYENGGTAKYKESDYASIIEMRAGKQNFKVAPSGSADASITWTTGFEVLNDGKARAKNGLLFGTDTAAANTLDDYEEGTFTPSLTFSTTTDCTYTTRAGSYVKIGQLVFVGIKIVLANKMNSSGVISVNLPFTANAATGAYAGGVLGFANNWTTSTGTLTYNTLFTIDPNYSAIFLRGHSADTGDYFSHTEGSLEHNADICISASYRAA